MILEKVVKIQKWTSFLHKPKHNCHRSPEKLFPGTRQLLKRLPRVCEEFQMKREGLEWFEKCNYLNLSVALIMHRQRAAHQRTSARLCPWNLEQVDI